MGLHSTQGSAWSAESRGGVSLAPLVRIGHIVAYPPLARAPGACRILTPYPLSHILEGGTHIDALPASKELKVVEAQRFVASWVSVLVAYKMITGDLTWTKASFSPCSYCARDPAKVIPLGA